MALADSAGQPWAGRHLSAPAFDGDDGGAPPALLGALLAFREGRSGAADVLGALRGVRLLVPLLAQLGEAGVGPTGLPVDKSAELALVTVSAPDGRTVLPAFTSVDAMRAWNPAARPIPAESERIALAAAAEGTDLLILDPRSATEFAVRRPALAALGRGTAWVPAYEDPAVLAEFRIRSAEAAVVGLRLLPGDPEARLRGPEVQVELRLRPGLDQAGIDALVARLSARWAESAVLAERVDSVTIRLLPPEANDT